MEIMTQKEKELLLKDLCARLPYGVKVSRFSKILKLISIRPSYRYCLECELAEGVNMSYEIEDIKPYLRPMSSMTEVELELCRTTCKNRPIGGSVLDYATIETFDWLNEHHFDYRGLIEKGLALEAPKSMYK